MAGMSVAAICRRRRLSVAAGRLAPVAHDLPTPLHEHAAHQSGIVTRTQAIQAGLSAAAIRERLRRDRWQGIYPGVYATFTGAVGRQAALWAAVLRAGAGAVLSHDTAAELEGLPRRCTVIHVSVPETRHLQPTPGLIIHRSDRIVAARHPARTPPRTRIEETVLDLVQESAAFEEAFDVVCRACGGRLTTAQHIRAAMLQRRRLAWRPLLAPALDDVAAGVHSVLEFRYVRGVERAHGLPRASRQSRVIRGWRTGYRDNLYAGYGVAVELDGSATHAAARWQDRERDNAAAADGIITLRYGWHDVTLRPCQCAAEIAAVLGTRGWRGAARRCGPACPLKLP
jgi:Transcriptional regulator, AbiEi antitoxin